MPPLASRLLGDGLLSYGRALNLGRLVLFLLAMPLLTGLLDGVTALQAAGYRIGPGDELTIRVWRQEDLSTTATVRPDGRITIPLFEDIVAAGKEPEALAREIEKTLSEFVVDPQVSVIVNGGLGDDRQRIRIVGLAVQPQALPYRADMTLLDAMIEIGGLAPHADGNSATLIRRTATGQDEIPLRLDDLMAGDDLTANVKLEPGDAIVIPEGFFSGGWVVDYSYTATQVFTDNIDQDRDGEETFGAISRSGFGINLAGDAARIRGSLDANVALVSQFGGDDKGLSADPEIAGTSTTELYRDHFFFDTSTSISRQILDTRTRGSNTAGAGASTEGTDVVATFSASPYVRHRVGSYADALWRYRVTPVLVQSGAASDVLDHELSAGLTSGRKFQNVTWVLSGRAGHELIKNEKDTKDANIDFDVTVPLSNFFALLGGIGYEWRDDESEDFSGMTWRGGFRWTPSPDTTVQATYGRRDDDDDLEAQVDYRIGPKTTFSASFTQSLDSSQGRAADNLGGIGIDDDGGLTGGSGDQPFDPDPDPFTFSDETTRSKILDASINHQSGNNSITFSGRVGKDEGSSDETYYEAMLSWSRPLNQNTSVSAEAGYERTEFTDEDRNDNTYTAGARLTYRLWSNVSSSLSYNFEKQQSTLGIDSFTENSITLSATISF